AEADLIPLEEEVKPPPPKAIAPPPPPSKPKAREVTVSDEIEIEDEAPKSPMVAAASTKKAQPPPPGPRGEMPIADLLSSESEEEIELLSITSDEEAAGDRPIGNAKAPSPDDMDLDNAFGKIAPQAAAQQKKVPAKKV